jgi:hypothetical protein
MNKLTFKEIREKCKSGEHLLVDEVGDKRLFLGFDRTGEYLVADSYDGVGASAYADHLIEKWTIEPYKPEPRFIKKVVYIPVYDGTDNESLIIGNTVYELPDECLKRSLSSIGYSEQTIWIKE